ncbi:hypothetical protein [Azospirillum brasilense]|nr:hypothetical protein [Azospirillum brasilense]
MTNMVRAGVLTVGETIKALTVVTLFSVFKLLERVAAGIRHPKPPH